MALTSIEISGLQRTEQWERNGIVTHSQYLLKHLNLSGDRHGDIKVVFTNLNIYTFVSRDNNWLLWGNRSLR